MTDRFIRFSETQAFRGCRRRWLNGYFLNLEKPVDPGVPASGKRDVGTICDLAVRHLYGDEIPVLETHARLKAEHIAEHGEMSKEWGQVFDLTERMLEGYAEWLAEEGADAGERTVGTEVELHTEVGTFHGDRVFLIGHIDRVLIDSWGEWVIEDTKTVDQFQKSEVFAIDDQLATYAWMWERVTGIPVRRARHNMLRRVKRTGSAKPPFYARDSINFNEEQMRAVEANLNGVLSDMVRVYQDLDSEAALLERNGVSPLAVAGNVSAYPSPSRDCSWWCSFEGICVAHNDGSDLAGLRQDIYVPRPERRTA